MESKVKQRTKEWFDIRKSVFLTSSKFGDALGVGLGKPYDFFLSLISESTDEEDEEEEVESTYTKHGQTMEEIILECHQLLTGFRTRETGFWMSKDRILQDLIGTSPDAVVIDDHKKDIGLCEFKAPIYRMYRKENSVHGNDFEYTIIGIVCIFISMQVFRIKFKLEEYEDNLFCIFFFLPTRHT